METRKYNGWTNYETWLVNLHFDQQFNDMKITKEDFDDEELEEQVYNLSEFIQQTVEMVAEEAVDEDNSFVVDLVRTALDECNFYEIAEHYVE